MTMLLVVFFAAVLASVAGTPLVARLATTWGVFDSPTGGRRIHTVAVPRVGGVAVFLAMILGLCFSIGGFDGSALAPGQLRLFVGILAGATVLFVTGLIDDLRELPPILKVAAQALAAVIVYYLGFRIQVITLGSATLEMGAFALPITIMWIVGVTNAYNLIDGLDGLATGIAVIALGTLLGVSIVLGRLDVALVATALLGALLGFLPYNFNPARIFLGDSGSLFVGFMLAVLSVHGATKSAAVVLVLVPLLALALPLLDTLLAVCRRLVRGVPISSADSRHIHHQLLAQGLTTRWTVLLLYGVATTLAATGVLLVLAPPALVTLITVAGGALLLIVLGYGMRRLDYHEFEEVGLVLATGPFKLRKILVDRVRARDVGQLIGMARNLTEVNGILEESAEIFRFRHMEVCLLSSPVLHDSVLLCGGSAWKIDYPVSAYRAETGDWYVLRVWCCLDDGFRPYGAERVAGILGPALRDWIVAKGGVEAFGIDREVRHLGSAGRITRFTSQA